MISLIVPCYNCASFIDEHLEKLRAFLDVHFDAFEIIVVDDGSSDSTPAHLIEWQKRDPRVKALLFAHNQGKGAAVKAGMLRSRGDSALFTDADLPYDLSAIPVFVEKLQNGFDVVLGARKDDGEVNGQKIHRTFLSRLFAACANCALREKVPDTQAGIKGFTKSAAKEIFAAVTIPRFCFDVEVIAIAQRRRMNIVSVPVVLVHQAPSTVRVGRDGLQMCVDLWRIFLRQSDMFTWRTVKQFFGYGAVGALNTLLSFGIINFLIVYTGVSSGPLFLFFSFGAFCVVVVHSFVWNKYLIFAREKNNALRHREYVSFFLVTSITSVLNLLILQVLVNVMGAPAGFSPHLWANMAIAVTIPVSVMCNFLGYKFFVFVV